MRTRKTKTHKDLDKFLRQNKCKRKFYRLLKGIDIMTFRLLIKESPTEIIMFIYCISEDMCNESYWREIDTKWRTHFYLLKVLGKY